MLLYGRKKMVLVFLVRRRKKNEGGGNFFFRKKCEFSFRRGEFWEGELVHLENL